LVGLTLVDQDKGFEVFVFQPVPVQQNLSCFRLQGGKTKDVFFILPEQKIYGAITKIAYTVKKNNGMFWFHGTNVMPRYGSLRPIQQKRVFA
jgi:hypothetical protein